MPYTVPREPTVYIFEPQSIFVPELVKIVTAAGGRVARTASWLDLAEVKSLRADFAVLDLDFTAYGALNALGYFTDVAREVNCIVLTGQHGDHMVERFLARGAFAVVSKDALELELSAVLREVFAGDVFCDPRVNAA